MPINLASPGILVREVDLTIGRVDTATDKNAAIVAPFAKGPVNIPILVENEQDLLDNFGEPYPQDSHFEHWMVASSYLAYGGVLSVVRAGGDDKLKNGFAGDATDILINSEDDYINKGYDESSITGVTVVGRNPGSWANGIKVALIDARADQVIGMSTTGVSNFVASITDRSGVLVASASTIGISTTGIELGSVVRCDVPGVISAGATVIGINSVTGIGSTGYTGGDFISISTTSTLDVSLTNTFDIGSMNVVAAALKVGYAVTQAVPADAVDVGVGATTELDGYFKGVITEIGEATASVKLVSHVTSAGVETEKDYQPNGIYQFSGTGTLGIHTNGQSTSYGNVVPTTEKDWFDQQQIQLSNQTINWNKIADRPGTSTYAASRSSRFDEVHVVVIDDDGDITGNSGTVLEKHLSLSKAKDAQFSAGSPSYWRRFLQDGSNYIFGGDEPVGVTTITVDADFKLDGDTNWNQNAQGVKFMGVGSTTLTLGGGKNYDGKDDITGEDSLQAGISGIINGYSLFENAEEYEVDFLLMGSGAYGRTTTQALANKIISVAELRKDAIAFISPDKGTFITGAGSSTATVKSSDEITDDVVSFYAPITSTTYGVFDSGYKYMYDRFADTFRYVPLNGDIAGMCARNDINNFPWFSPGGTARGTVLNAVKLAYNPSQIQRDKLYSNRVNPIIFSPGAGIILFGDKTGFGKASAFDRINVRRLFIYLEDAISAAARDQLFEFNDEITRTNFVNIVEPFLRDVQAKRGIFDFRVVCDETNNTAAIIDNNEFIADIFVKPARSINFIGLTFVATRTGISFEEVIGTV